MDASGKFGEDCLKFTQIVSQNIWKIGEARIKDKLSMLSKEIGKFGIRSTTNMASVPEKISRIRTHSQHVRWISSCVSRFVFPNPVRWVPRDLGTEKCCLRLLFLERGFPLFGGNFNSVQRREIDSKFKGKKNFVIALVTWSLLSIRTHRNVMRTYSSYPPTSSSCQSSAYDKEVKY